jgi:cystathionine beta-lyase/cystathionine gamma-synthase
MQFPTQAIHSARGCDPQTGAVTTPIYQTSTYEQLEPGVHRGYGYSRTENPTRRALEESLASLEGGGHGLAFASGLAAASAALSLLSTGDHVVAGRDLYGGAYRLFTKVYARFGVSFSFVDATDVAAIRAAIRPTTKLLWLETPSNPLLSITDIAAACAIAKERDVTSLVDNTFATPWLQRPLELGADVVLHSTTKYLNGHADVIGGALVVRSQELFERLKFLQNAVGAVPGPQDCFLVLRGIKTLDLRMERHCANARAVAGFLLEHEKVAAVHWPGIPTHPGHAVAKRQMKDFGAVLSFELKADVASTKAFTKWTKLFALAESLGSVRSLLCHPATMTHASVEPEVRKKNGISDGLIRLSVGCEAAQDLIADLEQALVTLCPASDAQRRGAVHEPSASARSRAETGGVE